VIVDDLNIGGLAVEPPETDSPPIVHANGVLPTAIAGESFETIPGRNAEIVQRFGRVEQRQLSEHDAMKLGRKSEHRFAVEKSRGVLVREAPDHVQS
jgi:hypothetical protein